MTTTKPLAPKLTMPTRPVTHPKFRYTPANLTNVARTWRKFTLLARLQGAPA
jgi:hypothetical protein